MSSQIRILAIAPYSGMESLLKSVSKEYANVDLTVLVGDLSRGVEIAQSNFHANYDAIISRGGTAKLLQQSVSIPVIEISTSVYDILCTLQLSGAGSHRVAVVGFANITEELLSLKQVLPYEIDVYTIESDEHAFSVLRSLNQAAYHAILCDMIAYTTAQSLGRNAFLITSGVESIRAAFSTAVWYCSSNRSLREENQFLRQLLQDRDASTVVFEENGKLFFSTLSGENSAALELLGELIDEVSQTDKRRFLQRFQGLLYSIQAQRLMVANSQMIAFYFTTSKPPATGSKYGIGYHSDKSLESLIAEGAVLTNEDLARLHGVVDQVNELEQHVMIFGEEGTGKERVARILHLRSSKRQHPFVEIECGGMSEKTWDYLLNHHRSPLCDKGNTLYFRGLNALHPAQCRQLLSALGEMEVGKRNRLVFSSSSNRVGDGIMPYVEQLGCFVMTLTPLRQSVGQLEHMVNLYLNRLNVEMAKNILGVEPQAMQLLREYHWPQNYTQFRRVVHGLATMAAGPFIDVEQVRDALSREQSFTSATTAQGAGGLLDLSRPLEEINRDIASLVLETHGGNRSKTAESLGISRTTLWRLLKEDEG